MLSDALFEAVRDIRRYAHSEAEVYKAWYSDLRPEVDTLLRLMDGLREYLDGSCAIPKERQTAFRLSTIGELTDLAQGSGYLSGLKASDLIGKIVKTAFIPDRPGPICEWMWAIVVGVAENGSLDAVLDNEPVACSYLTAGQRVMVDICRIREIADCPPAAFAEAVKRWQRPKKQRRKKTGSTQADAVQPV